MTTDLDKLSLRFFPDHKEILRTDCEDVSEDELEEYQDLIEGMCLVVDEVNGLGISAPQVGVPKNISVINNTSPLPGQEHLVLINPEITDRSGMASAEEGCLSFPGLYFDVDRARTVTYKALDREGEEIEDTVHGRMATVVQHEIDHLNGTLFIDHLGPVQRRLEMKKYKKLRKKAARADNDV
jgi:peptide deformylase